MSDRQTPTAAQVRNAGLVPKLLGHDCPEASEARAVHYRALVGEAQVFPGAQQLLRTLHQEGIAVVLASSAPEDELAIMRKLLDADQWIDAATSADDASSSKPAPDVFLAALRAGSVDPDQALVVGDSVWDVQAGRAAGLGVVAVETGGFSRHELAEEGAQQVFRDVAELGAQLRTSALGLLLPPR